MTHVVQSPRILHEPKSNVYSLGQEAIELASLAGLDLFDWEKQVLNVALGTREDGKWSAFEVGLVVSRQNGKGSILEARQLAGLFLLGEKLIIHSAHEFATSLEAFERIKTRIQDTPELDREIARISHSHGEEGLELKNGQRLRFRTRTKGGGRGFSCDCLILDEAMYLDSASVAALMPTLSARLNPQLWYTGSAGDKQSTQLGSVRVRAIKGEDPGLAYLEWSVNGCGDYCDPELRDLKCLEHDHVDDPVSWARANPSMGLMITEEHVAKEYRSMPLEVFKRERLGIGDWPREAEAWSVIPETVWMARATEVKAPQRPLTFAIDTRPDRSFSCIMAVGPDGEGEVCAEITSVSDDILDYRPGTSWVVPRVIELCNRWKPNGVIIDMVSQAGEFKDKLEAKGIKVTSPTTREYAQACGRMYSSLVPGRNNKPYLWHRDQEDLTNAVRGAGKRNLAGLWALDRQNETVDISPLVCLTLGLWGHEKFAIEKKSSLACAWG